MSGENDRWISVAATADVKPGQVVGVKVGDLDIAVYNLMGDFYATDNICTHALAYLSDGWLEGETIECPLHGGRFDVCSGKGLGAPITRDVKTYPARVSGDEIQVQVGA
jgi:naphthalene 1,2-dioxygenase system ferredoxin subunit